MWATHCLGEKNLCSQWNVNWFHLPCPRGHLAVSQDPRQPWMSPAWSAICQCHPGPCTAGDAASPHPGAHRQLFWVETHLEPDLFLRSFPMWDRPKWTFRDFQRIASGHGRRATSNRTEEKSRNFTTNLMGTKGLQKRTRSERAHKMFLQGRKHLLKYGRQATLQTYCKIIFWQYFFNTRCGV